MEELNKVTPSNIPVTKPTSESTETSLEFELVSKKDKKFPWIWVILALSIFSIITTLFLGYLNIINLPFLSF